MGLLDFCSRFSVVMSTVYANYRIYSSSLCHWIGLLGCYPVLLLLQLLIVRCSHIVTCATDKNLSMWDVQVGERIRKYRGHQTFVNTCDIARRGPQLLCSGSDDGTIRVSRISQTLCLICTHFPVYTQCLQ